MKHTLGNSFVAVVLSFVSATWFVGLPDPETENFLHGIRNDTIRDIDTEFGNRQITLNIHLNRSTSCEEIIQYMGIKNISVKEKQYAPTCKVVNDNLIVITYNELTNV